jgi:hypothetical protein
MVPISKLWYPASRRERGGRNLGDKPKIWDIEDSTVMTFANTSTNFAKKTIKLAVQIRDWPFSALQHSLALVLDSSPVSGSPSCVQKSEDENDNLKWVTINLDGVTLYLLFFFSSYQLFF